MAQFFVTYGFGSNLGNCYSIVDAANYGEARKIIHDTIGDKFAFCYEESEFEGQPSRYGLVEVPLQAQISNYEEE